VVKRNGQEGSVFPLNEPCSFGRCVNGFAPSFGLAKTPPSFVEIETWGNRGGVLEVVARVFGVGWVQSVALYDAHRRVEPLVRPPSLLVPFIRAYPPSFGRGAT
jgi:hypothetical protein